MSVRKDSINDYTICDDTTIAGDDLNRGMCMSFSDTLSDTRRSSVSDSLSTTVQGSKGLLKLNTTTKEHETVKCKPRMISEEIVLEPYQLPGKREIVSRFPENTYKTSKHPITGVMNEEKPTIIGEPKMDFDMENIQKSILWQSLVSLEDSLNASNTSIQNTSKDYSVTMENLNEVFNYSPRSFTESLMTIMEESFVESQEKSSNASNFFLINFLQNACAAGKFLKDQSPSERTISLPRESKKVTVELAGDSISPEQSKFLRESEYVPKLLEHESLPEGMETLPNESNIQTDSLAASLTNSSEIGNIADDVPVVDSAIHFGSSTFKVINSTATTPNTNTKTFVKTPKIIVNSATPTRNISSAVRDRNSARSRSPRKKIYRLTPKIIVTEERSEDYEDERITTSPRRSPVRSNDDDEYLTAESDTDESRVSADTQLETSRRKELNMSIIATNHKEWVKKYQQISRDKKLATSEKSSESTDRKRKLSSYMDKLEKQRIRELKEKRQKCFDLVEGMLQKPAASTKEPEVKSPCVCQPGKLSEAFCKVLSACYEYAQCAMDASEIYESSTKKKKSTSVASATMNLKTTQLASPHKVRKTPTKTRKSLNLKTKQLVSPRKVLRTPMKTRKSLSKSPSPRLVATRLKVTPSPSNHKSPRVSSIKRKGLSPVDTTSLRPVSEVRRIFSPRFNTAGSTKSNIPGASNTAESKNLATVGRGPTTSVRTVGTPAQWFASKKIVSPVGEYIRGKKKNLNPRSECNPQSIT